MGIRAVSGVIVPSREHCYEGRAEIFINTRNAYADYGIDIRSHTWFGDGEFVKEPCKHVSLRRFELTDSDWSSSGFDLSFPQLVKINDRLERSFGKYSSLLIKWSGNPSGLVLVREISFLVMGETE